jgi:hypothetical protein
MPPNPIERRSFEIRSELDDPRVWTWEESTALPSERVTSTSRAWAPPTC